MIGMVNSAITEMERSTSLNICIEIINRVELEIGLSASVETLEITATGQLFNIKNAIIHYSE